MRDAIYEIQRGYNLGDQHSAIDDGKADHVICAGGAFNKISEKLVSIIQGMRYELITAQSFQFSLHATIRRKIAELCANETSAQTALKENDNFLTLEIWNQIKAEVQKDVQAEFGEQIIGGKTVAEQFALMTDFVNALAYLDVADCLSSPAPI